MTLLLSYKNGITARIADCQLVETQRVPDFARIYAGSFTSCTRGFMQIHSRFTEAQAYKLARITWLMTMHLKYPPKRGIIHEWRVEGV